jgi:protein TonB
LPQWPPDVCAQRSVGRDTIYFEFQVERAAIPLPDNPPPHFPDALRAIRSKGSVLAQFVVDTMGSPDAYTFKVLRSSDSSFTRAVYEALATMRFTPARVEGRKVKQLVQMPFDFQLSTPRPPPPPSETHE